VKSLITRKRILVGAGALILLATLFCVWMASAPVRDVSNVHIGFAGYEFNDRKCALVLVVTNGSSYRIRRPTEYDFRVQGELEDDLIPWRDLLILGSELESPWRIPSIPTIAPGTTCRLVVPVANGRSSWNATARLSTIPL